jgi:hypothetical protein
MDDERHASPARPEVVGKQAERGPGRPSSPEWNSQEPRRFVDHEQGFILVKNLQT